MKIDISDLTHNISKDVAALIKDVEAETEFLADVVLEVAREATPEQTGTLKRGWQKRKEGTVTVVENPVPYAGYVDQGTSKMAGNHMTDLAVDAAMASKR